MIKTPETKIITIRPTSNGFYLTDGIQAVPRAQIEFTDQCPEHVMRDFLDAISNGWIQPVASMYDKEYTWLKLQSD